MFEELASSIVKTAPWGLMWRVCIGAILSVTDLFTGEKWRGDKLKRRIYGVSFF